ncbi:MAG: hypothetical protein JW910_21575, partial [Anaerolineae bacterium]|nr:hypothetical protein [Anaerolineae bacterium]
ADFRQVDDAAVVALAPEVILLTPAWNASAIRALLTNPAYENVPALQRGRVIRLPFAPTMPRDPGAAAVALGIALHPAALLLP